MKQSTKVTSKQPLFTEAKYDAMFKDMAKEIDTLKHRIVWCEENIKSNIMSSKRNIDISLTEEFDDEIIDDSESQNRR